MVVVGLFQLQMRISFPFLRAKELRTPLLITITCIFYSPVHREYMRKDCVHLAQKRFRHDCSTDSNYYSEKKKNLTKPISKQENDETETRHCYF